MIRKLKTGYRVSVYIGGVQHQAYFTVREYGTMLKARAKAIYQERQWLFDQEVERNQRLSQHPKNIKQREWYAIRNGL